MKGENGSMLNLPPATDQVEDLFCEKPSLLMVSTTSLPPSRRLLPTALGSLLFLLAGLVFLFLWWSRRRTRERLVQAGLPTVYWRPKFVDYGHTTSSSLQSQAKEKLASSNITNILPRMQRLKGPYEMYGTVYGVSTAVVHVAHPVPAQAILQPQSVVGSPSSNSHIRHRHLQSGATKAPAYNHFKNFCGEGVFTSDGLDWKQKRAAVTHALLARGYAENLQAQLETTWKQLAERFDEHATTTETSSSTTTTIDIVPVLQRATMRLIYRYITHSEPEQQGTAERETVSAYLQSIVRIRMIILAQSRSIWFLLPRWCYRCFSSMYRAEEETLEPVRSMARQACRAAQPGSPLARLVQKAPALYDRQRKQDHVVGGSIDKNLLDEAITVLFAGQDTSAATLSWTLHLLSLYPEIQTQLFQQVQGVLQDDDASAVFDKKAFSRMPLLDAVIKESMRLYPVAPFVVRQLVSPVTIPPEKPSNSAIALPAHSVACIWIYSLHRNPALWERPNDFWPERWLQQTNDGAPPCPAGSYMPFAAGPRNCVGQPLAHVILRTLLARLVHRYEFRDARLVANAAANPDDLRTDMQAGFTILPKGGVHLAVSRRK